MAERRHLELIHAEIDGELHGEQHGELARHVLADPEVRQLREELRRVCAALDALEQVDPPRQLRQSILDALPQTTGRQTHSWWSGPRLRYAALIAAALAAGTLVYETVHGPRPATSELAGTMAAAGARTTVDTVHLGDGPVSGRVSLYRDRAGVGLEFQVAATAPVDVVVTSDGHTLRLNGVGSQDKPGQGKPGRPLTLELPGLRMGAQTVDLTFLMDGRQVGSATLRAPGDR